MKKYTNEILQFDRMMNLCSLVDPAKIEFKTFARKRKTAIYKKILIALGRYTAFTGIALTFFFWGKKIAAALGMKFFATVLIISTASSMIAYKLITTPYTPASVTASAPADVKTETEIKASSVPEVIHYRLGLQGFTSTSAEKEIRTKADRLLINALTAAKGKKYASFTASAGEENVTYFVNTSIEKLDTAYYLQIKVIDKNTSAIKFTMKEIAESETALPASCSAVAQKIIAAVQ